MAFSRLMLTTDGKVLFAKAQQGKTLKFTRMAIGDGSIGTGSMINRTVLVSEKLSMLIDAVQLVDNSSTAAVVATMKNDTLTEGFYFRELGIFAEDPETQTEKLYVYDNAGTDGEFIPAASSGVNVSEYLKILLQVDGAATITFNASGNPLYLTHEDIGQPGGVPQLGTDGKVLSTQLPSVDLTSKADTTLANVANADMLTKGTAAGLETPAGAQAKADAAKAAAIATIPTSLPANGGNADTVGGYHAASLIRTDNIGSQSVNYANATGNANNANALGGVAAADFYRSGNKPFVAGSFTGDGVVGRIISLGFTPTFVIIWGNLNGAMSDPYLANTSYPESYNANGGGTYFKIVDGGFNVHPDTYHYLNVSGQKFAFMAFK